MDRGHIAYLSYILTSSLLSILGPSGRLMWLNLPPARHRCSVRPPTSEQKIMCKIDSYGKKNCTGVFSRSKLTNDVRVSHQNTPDFGFGEFFPKKINFIYSPSVQLYRLDLRRHHRKIGGDFSASSTCETIFFAKSHNPRRRQNNAQWRLRTLWLVGLSMVERKNDLTK